MEEEEGSGGRVRLEKTRGNIFQHRHLLVTAVCVCGCKSGLVPPLYIPRLSSPSYTLITDIYLHDQCVCV